MLGRPAAAFDSGASTPHDQAGGTCLDDCCADRRSCRASHPVSDRARVTPDAVLDASTDGHAMTASHVAADRLADGRVSTTPSARSAAAMQPADGGYVSHPQAETRRRLPPQPRSSSPAGPAAGARSDLSAYAEPPDRPTGVRSSAPDRRVARMSPLPSPALSGRNRESGRAALALVRSLGPAGPGRHVRARLVGRRRRPLVRRAQRCRSRRLQRRPNPRRCLAPIATTPNPRSRSPLSSGCLLRTWQALPVPEVSVLLAGRRMGS